VAPCGAGITGVRRPDAGAPVLFTPAFLLLALANLATVSSFGSFSLLPLFLSERGATQADMGVLMGAMALASVVCRPWTSETIDRMGRKKSYTAGSVLMTVVPLIYLLAAGAGGLPYVPFLLARLLHGVGLALCFTAVFTWAADQVPVSRLNEGIGLFGVSGLAGLALGPILGELVIRGWGFPAFFLVASALAGMGLSAHLLVKDTPFCASGSAGSSFFSVLRTPKATSIALMAALFGVGLAATGNFVAPFAERQGVGFVSLFYGAYSATAILARLLGGRLADQLGEARLIPCGLGAAAAGLAVLSLLGGDETLAIAGALTGCGHGLVFPSLNAAAVRNEPPEVRGKLTGVFTGGIDAGAFLGSIALGYVGEWAGFPALFAAAGLASLGGMGLFRLRRGLLAR
jgi:MFS family permease